MAEHQNSDGSWSLDRFHHTPSCRGRCRQAGHISSNAAGTALVLLPFLGAGQTHMTGIYQDVVSVGLRWLLSHQKPNGDLRQGRNDDGAMYTHGQATIVLCETYAMTRDERFHEPAQRAVDFIIAAQHSAGGWRYEPKQRGDTSVLGWQLMALHSARAAGLDVPSAALARAGDYLDSVQGPQGSRYRYRPGSPLTAPMTAEGLLCRVYLGWPRNHSGIRLGTQHLLMEHPPDAGSPNFYYWYYATQVMHHVGGPRWDKWNRLMRDVLVTTQETRGHQAGSWQPRGGYASRGGRLYVTSLAVCCLEVYYRHAPVFRRVSL